MISLREAAIGLLNAVESAIESGDWKVDGACDPTVEIIRLKNILAKPQPQWVGLTDAERKACWYDSLGFYRTIETASKEMERILKEKNS